jgi:hypothetical protein
MRRFIWCLFLVMLAPPASGQTIPPFVVQTDNGDTRVRSIQVELVRERYEALRVIVGETVYVRPRQVRVFMHAH